MEPIAEQDAASLYDGQLVAAEIPSQEVQGYGHRSFKPLQTLTSGRMREVRGGSIQAHVCVVAHDSEVLEVMDALQQAEGFKSVVSWCFAYRIAEQTPERKIREASEDGLDEGCGEKLLDVLRRNSLEGLLLIVSRWQDYGATSGVELLGTALYSAVVERCKDLITNLKQAVGLAGGGGEGLKAPTVGATEAELPPGPKSFNFCSLPALPEPRAPSKYGPNHFLYETALNRPASLPNLFSGGDVQMWMANDQCLRNLPDTELWALRSLRQPDWRVEAVLQAVAALRGQAIRASSAPAARWGQLREMLRSPTLRTELLLFDAGQVNLEAARHALQLLEGLDTEDIRRASPGAAALFEWARGVAQWRLQGPPRRTGPGPSQAAQSATLLRLPSQDKVADFAGGAHAAGIRTTRTAPKKRTSVKLGLSLTR